MIKRDFVWISGSATRKIFFIYMYIASYDYLLILLYLATELQFFILAPTTYVNFRYPPLQLKQPYKFIHKCQFAYAFY